MNDGHSAEAKKKAHCRMSVENQESGMKPVGGGKKGERAGLKWIEKKGL